MGQLVIEVTYGTKITKAMGNEMASWNLEAMHLIGDAWVKFWFVDLFHPREYALYGTPLLTYFPKFALYRAGSLELGSSRSL